jgi:hypothetical protein
MTNSPLHTYADFSIRFAFRNWPNEVIPKVAAGVYAIWKGDLLVYCGMSGRQFEKKSKQNRKEFGLITRLRSHASGRLSGDQFCVYVANRSVIPNLHPNDLIRFATGEVNLDEFTKSYIHEFLEYQYCLVSGSTAAYALEDRCRSGMVFGQKPFYNPANGLNR